MINGNFTLGSIAALFASLIVSVLLIFQMRKRPDPAYFKLLLGCIALIPFFGPLCMLWILVMPNRMPSELQGKHPKVVNSYSLPEFLKQDDSGQHPSKNRTHPSNQGR